MKTSTQQKPTNPDGQQKSKPTLSPQQLTAVDLLSTGETISQTAKHLGVTRQTVSQWFNHDSAFQLRLEARRMELWKAYVEQLRNLVPKAIAALERELSGKNAIKAAAQILQAAGLHNAPAPMCPIDVKALEEGQMMLNMREMMPGLLAEEDRRRGVSEAEAEAEFEATVTAFRNPFRQQAG